MPFFQGSWQPFKMPQNVCIQAGVEEAPLNKVTVAPKFLVSLCRAPSRTSASAATPAGARPTPPSLPWGGSARACAEKITYAPPKKRSVLLCVAGQQNDSFVLSFGCQIFGLYGANCKRWLWYIFHLGRVIWRHLLLYLCCFVRNDALLQGDVLLYISN